MIYTRCGFLPLVFLEKVFVLALKQVLQCHLTEKIFIYWDFTIDELRMQNRTPTFKGGGYLILYLPDLVNAVLAGITVISLFYSCSSFHERLYLGS